LKKDPAEKVVEVEQFDPDRAKIKIMYESLLPSINDIAETRNQREFLEFLKVNMTISVVACVDFTNSNLHTPSKISLHALDPDRPNMYQQAVSSVCHVLGNYDSDKLFPIYGFGANIQEPEFAFLDEIEMEDGKKYFPSVTPSRNQLNRVQRRRAYIP
jgi:hypothetical protein